MAHVGGRGSSAGTSGVGTGIMHHSRNPSKTVNTRARSDSESFRPGSGASVRRPGSGASIRHGSKFTSESSSWAKDPSRPTSATITPQPFANVMLPRPSSGTSVALEPEEIIGDAVGDVPISDIQEEEGPMLMAVLTFADERQQGTVSRPGTSVPAIGNGFGSQHTSMNDVLTSMLTGKESSKNSAVVGSSVYVLQNMHGKSSDGDDTPSSGSNRSSVFESPKFTAPSLLHRMERPAWTPGLWEIPRDRVAENPRWHKVLGAGDAVTPNDVEVGALCALPRVEEGPVFVIPSLEAKTSVGKYSLTLFCTKKIVVERV